ncbi:MAG: YfjI family protein, partial [Planctomycetota bacterium]
GRPSIMKTPALAEPLGVLAEFEAEARSRYESELDSHNADELLRDARLKQARKELDAAVRAGEDVQAAAATLSAELKEKGRGPTRQRYVVNDSTVEKTGELLAENPNGLLVFRDELTGFLKSLDKDGQECARAFYLEAWNGTGRFTYDRIGRGTLDIEACCVSVLGGIQPGPLSGYLAAARNGGRGDDGLMQRFQLAVWPDPSGTWRHVDRTPDALARREARETYRRLDTATAGEVGAVAAFKGEIPSLRFDDAAQACFDAWRTKLERRLRSDLPLAMESALGKYRSLVPSLALLIHLADSQNGGAVGPVALERALRWADYLESHSARVYASATQPEVAAAKSVLRKIKGGQLACPFTLRDVYRNAWSGLTTKAQAEAAVELLVDYDWLIAEPVATGGRPKTRYRPVHPPDKTDKCPLPSVLSGAEGVQGGEKSMDPSSPTFKPPESSVAFV